ncbi:MAG: NAD(P)H-quinone oxidoreductase [Alphaproteobacteria bacterium]|nr:NAD(P)H-quinone oxidoreductase [Alphaproteobacteria bacterium]
MLSTEMHAIICDGSGPPEVMRIAAHPMPVPGEGEVLIKVAAAGVNRADILQRKGKYPPPPGASDILGMEVAGIVAAHGANVRRWETGDKVCTLLAGGGYAEYAVAPENHCLPVPESLSLTEAALLPEAVVTVYANIFEDGHLRPRETILVHGGSSGIGTTAIQMVKLHGADIIVTAGSDEKCDACRKLGADAAINYNGADFAEAVKAVTNGRGVDIVLDMVGGDYVMRNLSVLAPRGRHLSIATQKGVRAEVDVGLVMRKRLTITGSTLRGRDEAEKARLIAGIEEKIWPWVMDGRLKPVVFQAFPLKNAGQAHKVMESGAHIGKIALEVS